MSVVSIKQLLEAGSHFGHQSRKWNPKMKPFIFTERNNIHIINLDETAKQINKAYAMVKDFAKEGKTVLFVGTKKQAQEIVKEEATRTGMFYVNTRWLGGTLTNFKTIKSRIARLNKLNQMEKVGEFELLPKKEVILLKAERDKLEKNLGGIKDMSSLPDLVFVVDPLRESICVKEARALNIPIIAIVDTNGNPDGIDVVIPANDDANKSVSIITKAMADAIIEAREGIEETPSAEEEVVDLKSALAGAVPTMEMAESLEEDDDQKRKFKKSKKSTKQDKKEEISAEEKVEEKSETKTDAE